MLFYIRYFTVDEERIIRLPQRVTLEHFGQFESKGCMSGFILIYIKLPFG